MSTKFEIAYLIFGVIISLVGVYLSYHWFGWKFSLVIFMLLWGNNISQRIRP